MSGLILQTKLFKPAPRPSLIARQHLIDRLNEGLGHGAEGFAARLTLVSAPAGFGKTTLVIAWLAQLATVEAGAVGSEVAWLSLDEGDNDVVRFLLYLIAALQTVAPAVGQAAKGVLLSPQPPPPERALTILLNDVSECGAPLVLVLDDYHVITNMTVHRALIYLLEHMPPFLHLLLNTRRDPPLPLSRLRARSQMTELRAADLRFTPDEVQQFFEKVMGVTLSEEEVAALDQRTEGWAVGLQMAGLSMQGREDLPALIAAYTGTHRFILDYLTDEVLEQRPKGTRNFLLQTSILDRFCGRLCEAVTGQPGGQAVLEQLEHDNLFLIPLDEERIWYRYHHLFAEVLRNRLQAAIASPGERVATETELYGRASAWFEEEGLIDEAVRHALAAQDVESAAALVERYSVVMFQRSEILTSRAWLERLPQELVQSRPRLILAQAWAMLLGGHGHGLEQWLSAPQARAALAAPDLPADIQGEVALLQATHARYRRDDALSLALALQAQELLANDDRGLLAGASFTIAAAHLHQGDVATASRIFTETAALGETRGGPYMALAALQELCEIQMRQGHLGDVSLTCQEMARMSGRWGWQLMPAAGMAHTYVGEVLYQRNELEEAARELSRGTTLLRGSTEQVVLAMGYVTLCQIQMARGDFQGALVTIEQGEEWLTEMHLGDRGAGTLLALGKCRLRLGQGQLNAAAQWFAACRWENEETNTGYMQRVGLVRLRLAENWRYPQEQFPIEVVEMLDRLISLKESGQWFGQVIELLILQALVSQAQGDFSGALSILEGVLGLAEPEGYVRVFVDEGEPMADLLHRARRQGIFRDYVETLLDAYVAEEPATAKQDLLPDPLSERELEVLRLAATGATNKDIGEALFIALPTVKKHMGHILVKLDTQNRVEAIARARELDLL